MAQSAAEFLPERLSLKSIREAEPECRGCELYQRATQVVGGEGPAHASMVLVGEAPGDEEDKTGRPFVGPAGRLLDQALEAAGVSRQQVFVTNAVKHFSWEPQGKRRLHAKPKARQIAACRPWLDAELQVIKPKVIVCLGATAAQALLGKEFKITKQRGQAIAVERSMLVATYHPSAVLRAPDPKVREEMKQGLIDDLIVAVQLLK